MKNVTPLLSAAAAAVVLLAGVATHASAQTTNQFSQSGDGTLMNVNGMLDFSIAGYVNDPSYVGVLSGTAVETSSTSPTSLTDLVVMFTPTIPNAPQMTFGPGTAELFYTTGATSSTLGVFGTFQGQMFDFSGSLSSAFPKSGQMASFTSSTALFSPPAGPSPAPTPEASSVVGLGGLLALGGAALMIRRRKGVVAA